MNFYGQKRVISYKGSSRALLMYLQKAGGQILCTCTWSGSMHIACRTLGLMGGELGRALEESWCILSQGWCDGRRIATWKLTTKVRVVASSGLGRVERKYPWNIFYFTLSCPNISSYPLYHFQKTLPKAQRTRGLSSSYESNLMGHITSSNTNLDQISSS